MGLSELELDGFGIEVQPHLKEVDCETDEHDEDHDGKCGLRQDDNNPNEDMEDILCIDRLVQICEHIGRIGRNGAVDGVPQEFEPEKADEQHKRAVQLLTAGDLPLLARIGALLRRRFLCLFTRETLEVKDECTPIEGRVPRVIYFHTFH